MTQVSKRTQKPCQFQLIDRRFVIVKFINRMLHKNICKFAFIYSRNVMQIVQCEKQDYVLALVNESVQE